jgi:nanoRNase/pAp phosphatase (c-di-AMP/oligoRNAs hydrolase)
METPKHRLLTRSDFDGLVCAVLLKELDLIDEIKFVHPKDVQDGKVEITDRDILTNLPYVSTCHLCFDHHDSEEIRTGGTEADNLVLVAGADSAARVVYDHYGGAERFPNVSVEMIEAVDRADAARFDEDEVLDPTGWTLLSFLMDARTGLGRFRDFRVSNYQLMMELIDCCQSLTIEEILELPDVKERVDLYREHEAPMKEQLQRCTTVHGPLAVLDLRDEETIYAGNRFLIYALFPQCNVSMHVIWGLKKQNTVFAIGKSIFDRSCTVDIGTLALQNGGGGHEAAGTCQIDNDEADSVMHHLIDRLSGAAVRAEAA